MSTSLDDLYDYGPESPTRELQKERKDTFMYDTEVIREESLNTNGVVYGAYGASEFITNSHFLKNIKQKINSIADRGTWVTPSGFKLAKWVPGICERYNFVSPSTAIMFFNWGLIEVSYTRGKLDLEFSGAIEEVEQFMVSMDKTMKRAENLIEWIHGARGESVTVPLNYREPIMSAYPWIDKNLYEYINDYLNSSSCVLILIGPPGVGKTSFIKTLIHHSKGNAQVTFDDKIMSSDSLFANFIEGDTKFMIMEDADAFLKSRSDGNTMMHRFLNVSEGLVSAADKKLVFSTNLPSVKDIDEALLRPGRCFDILEFRELTREEAQVVCEEIGKDLPDGNKFTLAELFTTQPSSKPGKKKSAVGFL